ncbi:MAG: DnaA/Hda family protein [Pirellulaceae bacterium]|nr:ATP-binding protein [Planctomycetales bacterium]
MVTGTFTIPLQGSFISLDLMSGSQPDVTGDVCPFVAGHENALLAVAIQDLLGEAINLVCRCPLVLIGPTGVGKTHLAWGIAATWKYLRPQQNVLVTSAGDWRIRWMQARKDRTTETLRRQIDNCSLLVIDDVHQLAMSEIAQDELAASIDDFRDSQRLIIATSSVPPASWPDAVPRLVSRLLSGLSLSIQLPTVETRPTLLQSLADRRALSISPPAVTALAKGSYPTARDLDAALSRCWSIAHSRRLTTIDESIVETCLLQDAPTELLTVPDVIRHVAQYYKVPVRDVTGPSRRQQVVLARSLAMYLTRNLIGCSLNKIGGHFGKRDHSTVMHALRKAAELVESDLEIRNSVNELTTVMQNTTKTKTANRRRTTQ